MDCPRCGQPGVTEPACPRCGVIVAKARAARATSISRPAVPPVPAYSEPAAEVREGPGVLVLVVGGALLLVAGAVGHRLWERTHRRPAVAAAALGSEAVPVRTTRGVDPPEQGPPPSLLIVPPPAMAELRVEVPDADRGRADALVRRLAVHTPLAAADVQVAEELLASHPTEQGLRDLLETVLITAAMQHHERRQFAQATAYLQRARQVQPTSTRPLILLMQVAMDTGDWAGAETAARAAIGIAPRGFDGWQGLGYALMRQDRNREALEAIRSALEIRDDTNLRLMMERIQKGLADERGMSERRVSHFNVRYDGEEHEAVGREIVRALERHYATLASALDYEPTSTIAVILFTREGYYNASGAPAWSGGAFDNTDGRIRIPIGGLTTSLTPDIDATLIHELVHAFVADRTHGTAPRELHEGLAQYMEGKRIESMLSRENLTALADGRIGGVAGFYLGALSFVEYLIANRGLGGMNELLKVMGETGSVDEAFRQVHGMTQHAALQAWNQRFRQQHGSG
jgi:tetratricopeptide (TPR) repeat protein